MSRNLSRCHESMQGFKRGKAGRVIRDMQINRKEVNIQKSLVLENAGARTSY